MSTSSAFAAAKRAPSLSDVEPDKGHEFDQRSQQFRDDLVAAHKKRDELESESVITAQPNQYLLSDPGKSSEADAGKKGGRLANLIYGTPEAREMDKEIERSFSQVLARGKYMHSIVFHDVKPDKVDEYVELVGHWYPRMANMPENKVNLVGSWRTEVGDCDTFGEFHSLASIGILF